MTRLIASPRRAALLLVLFLGTALRTAVAAQGWFYYDDLTLYAQAREHNFPDLGLLFQDHDGHLMPGSWLIVWLLSHLAPLNWPAAVAVLGLGNLAAGASVAWAYRPLSRSLIPLGFYLLTPITLTTSTWLASAVNTLPLHIALALCLGFALRAMQAARDPYRGYKQAAALSLRAGLSLLGGALLSERALFIAPTVFLVLWCCGQLPGQKNRRATAVLALYLWLPTLLWFGVYALSVGDPRTAPASPLPFITHGYGLGLLPTLAGGPWHWERWHPGPPWAAPDTAVILLGAASGCALLALTLRRATAWIPVLLYPLLPFVALALARSGPDTALEITQTLRHVSEVAVLAAVALAYALPARLPLPAKAPMAVWVLSSLLSTITFTQTWATQPARDFFHGLRTSLQGHDTPLLNQDLPLEVLLPVTNPYNKLSAYGAALGIPSPVGETTSEPMVIRSDGSLLPAQLHEMRTTISRQQCETETALPLDGPLLNREWVVRLNYFSSEPGIGALSLDEKLVEFPVEAGLHSVYIQVTGGGTTLHASAPTACFGRSTVGILIPSE
ncbi:hypothetical protein [Corynebacterium lowii]|uniref:Glycosyltransferase RgtA/B/C/D-like domain-containing protein n=1 Tax=Corynebacterium lowii TaxID=1544413 RepID=A0A0Q0ZBE1_9CORY|nr:hypothetical protein [Corynebacterium lowii]KQB87337.1 hypothetical protein Clow_00392 [Corynebacterium lowii]MDP9852074.1 hypothetical protein [Corynebacterium lowii]